MFTQPKESGLKDCGSGKSSLSSGFWPRVEFEGNATDFGFLKLLLLLLLQALPENRFRGDVLFLCHPPGVLHISATSICFEGILLLCALRLRVCTILPGQGASTCRISLIAAILTDFKQVLALPSKCVGSKN